LAQNTPNFNTEIPAKLITPDRVPTRLGTLEFFDGMPTEATASKVLEHLTFLRGVEAFLSAIPAASVEALRAGLEGFGVTDDLMDSSSLFLTGNTDTVYAVAVLDLGRDGPTVVEIPAGCGPGTVDDAWFRFVIDMGAPGPDRGQGGKYLILPPGYDGEVPDGYFTATSTSYVNLIALRGFLVDGKTDAASHMFRDGVKIYPLDRRDDPPAMEFINGSGQSFNTIHASNAEFYDEVHTVIDREPVGLIDPETQGLLASIGIRKGKPFAPDERLREILTDAAAVGNATARAIFFNTAEADNYLYEGSYWKRGFYGGNYQFLLDGEDGVRNLDARTAVFYMATLNTPAMTAKMVGLGSRPTPMVPSTSTSGHGHRKALSRTGSRQFRARAGSPSCVFTARWIPGSTRPGGPARSSSSRTARPGDLSERSPKTDSGRVPAPPGVLSPALSAWLPLACTATFRQGHVGLITGVLACSDGAALVSLRLVVAAVALLEDGARAADCWPMTGDPP